MEAGMQWICRIIEDSGRELQTSIEVPIHNWHYYWQHVGIYTPEFTDCRTDQELRHSTWRESGWHYKKRGSICILQTSEGNKIKTQMFD